MNQQEPVPNLIGLREACKLVPSHKPGKCVHIETLYYWIKKGRIRGWRRGCWWFVDKAEILALAKEFIPPTPVKRGNQLRQELAWHRLRKAGIA